jgi:pimeloyl-ACP methyl ester carboxylesterase
MATMLAIAALLVAPVTWSAYSSQFDSNTGLPVAGPRAAGERVPSCVFTTVAEAGHYVHWERPDKWNRLVLDFLAVRFAAS